MPAPSGPHFLHHHQTDGSWKSICPVCEQLVIADDREDGLAWIESFHFCEPDHLYALTHRPTSTPVFPFRQPPPLTKKVGVAGHVLPEVHS